MTRYLARLGWFLLVQACFLAGVVHLSGPPGYYIASTIDKQRLLASAPSPRLVLVGGSNLAFGIKSPQLQDGLGGQYNVVNMAVQGGLGLGFALNETLAGLRSGDIVVISPEYEVLWFDEYQPFQLTQALVARPSSWRYIPTDRRMWFVASAIPQAALPSLHQLAVTAAGRYAPDLFGDALGTTIYRRSLFNEFGDHTSIRESRQADLPPDRGERLSATRMESSLSRLRQFHREAERRGARVFVAYPPLPQYRWNRYAADFQATHAILSSKTELGILGEPAQEVYPESSFYDTVNHLTDAGAEARTRQLIENLRPRLP